MTLEQALKQAFPRGTLGYASDELRASFEINGLAAGTVPGEGVILERGNHRRVAVGERREQFLVKTASFLLFFRICSAGPGSGYAEFATGWAYPTDGPDADEFLKSCRDSLQGLCV